MKAQLIDEIAQNQDVNQIEEFLTSQPKNNMLDYQELIKKAIHYENLKPLKVLMKQYIDKSYEIQNLSVMVANETIFQNKDMLFEKEILARLTNINDLMKSSINQHNQSMFECLINHENIAILPDTISIINTQVYETGNLNWIEYCEEKTQSLHRYYIENERDVIFKNVFSNQSIELLEYLRVNHHMSLNDICDGSQQRNEFFSIFTTASYMPKFYDKTVLEQVQFLDYLLTHGAQEHELLKGYFSGGFNQLNKSPKQQELFNHVALLFTEKTYFTIEAIGSHCNDIKNIKTLAEGFLIFKEAQHLEQNVKSNNALSVRIKL